MAGRLSQYKGLFDDIRAGRLARIYFLHGPEEHMKREIIRELIRAALPGADRAFNLDIVYGDDFDAMGFEDRLRSFPLFASRRVLILRNFEALSPRNRELVVELVGAVPAELTLIIESASEKLDTVAHKRLAAAAGKAGVAFACGLLNESETLERVLGRFRREGVRVEPDALDLLIESVGTRLIDLSNEVDKILLAAGTSQPVTRELVSSVVGKYRTESLFALLDGLGTSAPATTLPRLARLLEAGEEPVLVVAMMIRRVVSLLEVQATLHERGRAVSSDRALAETIAATTSPFVAGRLRDQAARASRDDFETLLVNLRWADTKLKSTSLESRGVIEEALLASHVRKTLATAPPGS